MDSEPIETIEPTLPVPGDRIADKYVVEELIATGGMGVVLLARHDLLDQRVAIKMLLPHMIEVPDVVSRFLREAQASVGLRGRHVVRVFDVGTLPGGAPYMVMEYLEGNDLGEELERRLTLPIEEAVGYVLEACEALVEAHAMKVVHRDVKPSNLFVCRQPDGSRIVKVVDFGISKVLGERAPSEDVSLTQTATMLGSPQYMSPEQVRSARDVDCRTDIWALGCVLYEVLTGVAPFAGESVSSVSAKIVADQPPRIERLRPGIDPALVRVIGRCLEKNRSDRFQTVAELAQALSPFAGTSHRDAAVRIANIASTGATTQPSGTPSSVTEVEEHVAGGEAGALAETVATSDPAVTARSAPGAGGDTLSSLPPGTKHESSHRARLVIAAIAAGVLLSGAIGLVLKGRQAAGEPAAEQAGPAEEPHRAPLDANAASEAEAGPGERASASTTVRGAEAEAAPDQTPGQEDASDAAEKAEGEDAPRPSGAGDAARSATVMSPQPPPRNTKRQPLVRVAPRKPEASQKSDLVGTPKPPDGVPSGGGMDDVLEDRE